MIKFKITKEDIQKGVPYDDYNNPLGMALQRIFPRKTLISVGRKSVQIHDKVLELSPQLIEWLDKHEKLYNEVEFGAGIEEIECELNFSFMGEIK